MRKLGSQSGAYNVNNGQRQIAVVQPSDNLIANNLEDAKKLSVSILTKNTGLKVGDTLYSDNLDLNQLNRFNQQVDKLSKEYKLSPNLNRDNEISLKYKSDGFKYGSVRRIQGKNFEQIKEINFGHKTSIEERIKQRVEVTPTQLKFAAKSKVDIDKADLATLTHEFGHVINRKSDYSNNEFEEIGFFWNKMENIRKRYRAELTKLLKNKKYNVSRMIHDGFSWKAIKKEIEKCEVVCANCHRVRTYNRLTNKTA
jgi:phenylalanyl-tRNA synthetase alpha subunit